MYKHILIPIDGPDMSTDAARRALDFAKIHEPAPPCSTC